LLLAQRACLQRVPGVLRTCKAAAWHQWGLRHCMNCAEGPGSSSSEHSRARCVLSVLVTLVTWFSQHTRCRQHPPPQTCRCCCCCRWCPSCCAAATGALRAAQHQAHVPMAAAQELKPWLLLALLLAAGSPAAVRCLVINGLTVSAACPQRAQGCPVRKGGARCVWLPARGSGPVHGDNRCQLVLGVCVHVLASHNAHTTPLRVGACATGLCARPSPCSARRPRCPSLAATWPLGLRPT
jgi:hypothetical protein